MGPVSTTSTMMNNSDNYDIVHRIRLFYILPIIIVGIIALSSFGDSYADSIITTITVINGPGYLTSSTNYIYSANPLSNTVTVIDSTAYTIVTTIPVGHYPYGISYDGTDNKIYVSNSLDNTVSVINPSTNAVTIVISGLTTPTGIVFDSTNKMIYVANSGSGSVSVIDPSTNTVSTPAINVGGVPYGLAFDKIHNRIYVANSGSNSVSVIDASTNTVIKDIPVGTNPQNVAFDSINGYIYVANSGSNSVSVIDTSTNTIIGTPIPVGNTPLGITFNSVQNTIYVANSGGTTVSIIDGSTNTVTSTFNTTLPNPFGVTYDPSTGKIFVANLAAGIITVLDPTTGGSGGTTPPPPPPPPLSLTVYPPAPVYPSSHLGANVVYTAPTTSGGSGSINIICDHPSDSLFQMGTTTVSCTATDSTSSVTQKFPVQVYTTSDITKQLTSYLDSINLPYGLTNSLYVKISQFIITTGNADQVNSINAFKNEVDAKCCDANGKPLSIVQANSMKQLADYIIASLS